MPTDTAWVFDPALPSGAQTGGNVAEYAFRPDIETFVREIIQNVLDNISTGADKAEVLFRLIQLKGPILNRFLQAILWMELKPHIVGAGRERNGQRFVQALENLETNHSLLILVVEDRYTTGLIGSEKGDSNFAALCRNTLYSSKPSETSGGSYGLGKAVLWLFSDLSTVLFNSVLERENGLGTSPRFIGRSELPWHQVGNREFDGSGWLGLKSSDAGGREWAKSLWSPRSADLASKLFLERDSVSGTSILVVGFRNPADEDQEPKVMAQEMIDATAKNFWPSIINSKLAVKVEVVDAAKNHTSFSGTVDNEDISPEFAACWNAYRNGRTLQELKNPGDVVEVPIELTIPPRVDGSSSQLSAEASLVVRLAEENSQTKTELNQVAFFRGTGMVVKHESYNRLSITQRPFHGILVCGKARRSSTENDTALDEFLRAAEPPEHKSWDVTVRLKETYKPGYRKLLVDMENQVRDRLRELVTGKAPGGTDGPRLLMNLFPLGNKSKPPPPPPTHFKVKEQRAKFVNGRWEFSGHIEVKSELKKKWKAEIDLKFQAEDSSDSTGGVVHSLTLDPDATSKGAVITIKKGKGIITAPASVKKINFDGITDPSRYPTDARWAAVTVGVRTSVEEVRDSGE